VLLATKLVYHARVSSRGTIAVLALGSASAFCVACHAAEPAPVVRCEGRDTTDREDDFDGHQVHVVYALPSDGTDRELDVESTLTDSIDVMNTWLAQQTGGARLRFDTCRGALDISMIRSTQTDAEIAATDPYVRDTLELDLVAAGFNDSKKLYMVYYDGSSNYSCGGGAWPPAVAGAVAALYLRGAPAGSPPCDTNAFAVRGASPGYLEFAMLHEIIHTLGVVGTCAPNHVLSGHVGDSATDLMYAGSEAWRPEVLDIGNDDYFQHGNPSCVDLARSAFLDPLPADAQLPPAWQ
jgi:hypothetical protein